MRTPTRAIAALTGAALFASATAMWSSSAPRASGPIVARSFTILAEAFPEAPVPGRGSTELGAKPLGTRVTVSNAPASAYGRAAVSDNGTIELYTGPPPPGSFAECDSLSSNIPDDADAQPGASTLAAHCRAAPSAFASASGAMSGTSGSSGSSSASGDGSGDAASATASATVNDVTVGPVHIGSAHYDATAVTDGTREGASGNGRVSASDATVAGVPVLIGPDGVSVDKSKVPSELVPSATQAVQAALGQGGYLNVRAAQPEVVIADDGSAVTVRGGGVFFEGQSNDPTQPYFLRETLVGGSLSIAVGAEVGGGGPADEPVATGPGATSPGAPAASASPGAVATPAVVSPDVVPEVIAQRTVHRTRAVGLAWLWIVAVAVIAAATGYVFRRRLAPWWDAIADRYLRG